VTTFDHWQRIYTTRGPSDVGFYEPDPATSRHLVEDAVDAGARSVIDVGGGAAFLVDALLELDLDRIAVLDLSPAAIERAQARLGERADRVEWIAGDITAIESVGRFDLWHDRAVFHFLMEADDRRHYTELASRTVPDGGRAIIATFALDGPERCSGLPVHRYDAEGIAAECGPDWRLLEGERHTHLTPLGIEQRYVYATLARVA
jgi:SAM-dependent methyltransferase